MTIQGINTNPPIAMKHAKWRRTITSVNECMRCRFMNGKIKRVERGETPQYHPNCKCTFIPTHIWDISMDEQTRLNVQVPSEQDAQILAGADLAALYALEQTREKLILAGDTQGANATWYAMDAIRMQPCYNGLYDFQDEQGDYVPRWTRLPEGIDITINVQSGATENAWETAGQVILYAIGIGISIFAPLSVGAKELVDLAISLLQMAFAYTRNGETDWEGFLQDALSTMGEDEITERMVGWIIGKDEFIEKIGDMVENVADGVSAATFKGSHPNNSFNVYVSIRQGGAVHQHVVELSDDLTTVLRESESETALIGRYRLKDFGEPVFRIDSYDDEGRSREYSFSRE